MSRRAGEFVSKAIVFTTSDSDNGRWGVKAVPNNVMRSDRHSFGSKERRRTCSRISVICEFSRHCISDGIYSMCSSLQPNRTRATALEADKIQLEFHNVDALTDIEARVRRHAVKCGGLA